MDTQEQHTFWMYNFLLNKIVPFNLAVTAATSQLEMHPKSTASHYLCFRLEAASVLIMINRQ